MKIEIELQDLQYELLQIMAEADCRDAHILVAKILSRAINNFGHYDRVDLLGEIFDRYGFREFCSSEVNVIMGFSTSLLCAATKAFVEDGLLVRANKLGSSWTFKVTAHGKAVVKAERARKAFKGQGDRRSATNLL